MVQDSQVILVSSKKLIDAVEEEIQIQLEALPRKDC
jgi:histidinol dehydrogenase